MSDLPTSDFETRLEQRVRGAAPDGVDVALDTAGTDEALDVSVAVVADRSRIATIAGFEHAERLGGVLRLGGGAGADPGTALRDSAREPLVEAAGRGELEVVLGRMSSRAGRGSALSAQISSEPDDPGDRARARCPAR